MVSETYFTRISSTAANPPSTADAIAGVLTGAAVAGAVASSTEYCRIPETCSTFMSRGHAAVSESMSSLINEAYLGERRKKLASPSLFEYQAPRASTTKPSTWTTSPRPRNASARSWYFCTFSTHAVSNAAKDDGDGYRRLVRHDKVGPQRPEITAHAMDVLVQPNLAWEPGGRGKFLALHYDAID